jgi:hypothetical protein
MVVACLSGTAGTILLLTVAAPVFKVVVPCLILGATGS